MRASFPTTSPRLATAVARRRALGVASVCAVCVVLVSAASAAAPLAYVTPTAMAVKIRASVPQIPTDNMSPPSTITASSCKGLPPAKAKKFNTFRCAATWQKGKATVWARALPGGKFCASSTGLAACPAGPTIAGDPRVCTYPPTPPTADPNRCALAASLLTITRSMPVNFADPGWRIRNVSCTGSNLTHKCVFSSFSAYGTYYTSLITFAQADGALEGDARDDGRRRLVHLHGGAGRGRRRLALVDRRDACLRSDRLSHGRQASACLPG